MSFLDVDRGTDSKGWALELEYNVMGEPIYLNARLQMQTEGKSETAWHTRTNFWKIFMMGKETIGQEWGFCFSAQITSGESETWVQIFLVLCPTKRQSHKDNACIYIERTEKIWIKVPNSNAVSSTHWVGARSLTQVNPSFYMWNRGTRTSLTGTLWELNVLMY